MKLYYLKKHKDRILFYISEWYMYLSTSTIPIYKIILAFVWLFLRNRVLQRQVLGKFIVESETKTRIVTPNLTYISAAAIEQVLFEYINI